MEELLKSLLSSPEGVKAIVQQYKPLLYSVCGEIFGMYKDLVDNDEYYEVNAANKRKQFNALIKQGFTEDQAMQIVIANIAAFNNYARSTSGASVKLNY